jgi:phosphatidylglycerol:prolipoprotein diacylglycerol transferase
MRPRLNEFLLNAFDSPALLYLVPSGITIYFIAIGLAFWLYVRRCRLSGLDTRRSAVAGILAVAGGLLGARAYYLLHHFDHVSRNTDVIFSFGAGIASWGAYIGGLLVFVPYLLLKKMETLRHLDILASVLGLGVFFVRLACFLNGCCYGTPAGAPWAVQYPAQGSLAFRSHLEAGLVSAGDFYSLPVHPVQVYLSALGLFGFVVASLFWRRYSESPGATFLFYWLMYGIGRFLLEFMRGDVPRYTPADLTLSQIVIVISLTVLLVAARLLFGGQPPGAVRTST